MRNSRLSRREFLQGCSAGIAALAGARLTRVGLAAPSGSGADADPLVVVFLRGGWDALSVLAPLDGEDRKIYEAARPTLKIPAQGENSLIPLDDRFGMHPALAPLVDQYQGGRLAFIHAVGLNYDTRSHFDAMEYIELGTPGVRTTTSGWITRHLETKAAQSGSALLPAISIPAQPTSLLRNSAAVSLTTPADLGMWDNGNAWLQQQALRSLYGGEGLLHQVGRRTLDALQVASRLQEQEYQPENGAYYNDDEFGRSLRSVAQLIKAEVGMQVATVDLGGWDTHEYQNDRSWGYLADLLSVLGDGLANFAQDLDGRRVTTVVISEFGRRLAQNESHGTDHGHGSLMLALGEGVNGGQVLGDWPGLASEALYDRADLAVTTDYRQVLGELLTRRLGNPNVQAVFPGFGGASPLGVFRAA